MRICEKFYAYFWEPPMHKYTHTLTHINVINTIVKCNWRMRNWNIVDFCWCCVCFFIHMLLQHTTNESSYVFLFFMSYFFILNRFVLPFRLSFDLVCDYFWFYCSVFFSLSSHWFVCDFFSNSLIIYTIYSFCFVIFVSLSLYEWRETESQTKKSTKNQMGIKMWSFPYESYLNMLLLPVCVRFSCTNFWSTLLING